MGKNVQCLMVWTFACLLLNLPFLMADNPNSKANVVFQIGTFDRSSMEFAQGNPTGQVNFIVGRSEPAKDWYASQPVQFLTTSGAHGPTAEAAPRSITFLLQHSPGPSYRFHIAVLIETSSVPVVQVGINGRLGRFYLRPVLDDGMGDFATSWFFVYSHADVVFIFPGRYLHKGTNTITVQALEDTNKGVTDASLTYDALQLDSGSDSPSSPPSAEALPTIFYQRKGNQLAEIVDVFLHHDGRLTPGSIVTLTIDGKTYRQSIPGNRDFGEEKLPFSVAEFSSRTRAHLAWNIDGHWRNIDRIIEPAKKWTLYVVPNVHLDVGFTDYPAKVAAVQSRVIDEALNQVAKHPEFRFSIDGMWSVDQFLKERTPAQQDRLISAVQKQEIFVPPQYDDMFMGFPTAETLIRSFYAGAKFSRMHGTPFNYVNITDTPSYTWSYASIIAAAGIKYLLAGGNNIRAPVWLQGHLTESSPMWWEGPDGARILLWYSRHYEQVHYLFGMPPELSAGVETLPLFLQMYDRPSYRANATIIFGTQTENTDLFPQQAELVGEWNKLYDYPRLQYTGFYDAIRNVAGQFGNNIPIIQGDGGPYWDDSIAADAYYAAMERENETRAPSAEKLATLATLINPLVAIDKPDIDRMWTQMVLMDEHCWSSWDSVSNPKGLENTAQLAVKESRAIDAHQLVDSVARNSMATIVDSISAGEGSLIVFNTLNWARSGTVETELADNQEIVDESTNQIVPVELLSHDNSIRLVRFLATDVPAVGYKLFRVQTSENPTASPAPTFTTRLESPFYRVELDPKNGAVRSIYDKQLMEELVNEQSPYRFGQYLYVTGGDARLDSQAGYILPVNTLLLYPFAAPPPTLEMHPAHDGKLISVVRTPSGWVARMESTDTNTPVIVSEIRLFDRQKKIEFVEDVDKKEVETKEAVYFAFPFAMDRPRFKYEIQTAAVDPETDMYPGAGHEWFSVQHWISVQQNGISATVMPLDTSLVTLGDINRGAWPSHFDSRTGTIFSYVMNNYWYTNFRAGQGGHFHFRYIITSGPSTDAGDLSRLGWEEVTPLEVDQVISQDESLNTPRPLNAKEESFLEAQDPKLLLETWKTAEDGKGTILRFLDLGGTERSVSVRTPLLELKQVWQTDAVERNTKQLSMVGLNGFQFIIHPHEIVTVRVLGSDLLPAPSY